MVHGRSLIRLERFGCLECSGAGSAALDGRLGRHFVHISGPRRPYWRGRVGADIVHWRTRQASAGEELQSLPHERFVILEDASVSGILIEDEFRIRQAARKVDRVAAGHHFVMHDHRDTGRGPEQPVDELRPCNIDAPGRRIFPRDYAAGLRRMRLGHALLIAYRILMTALPFDRPVSM